MFPTRNIRIISVASKFRELWSPARQQIWPWIRSKVTVKVTTWYHWKGLVTKTRMPSIKALSVKVQKLWPRLKFFVTDRQTDRRMRFNVPTLSRKWETTSTLTVWETYATNVNLTNLKVHVIIFPIPLYLTVYSAFFTRPLSIAFVV